MSVDERLAELGIVLPATNPPAGSYVSTRRAGNLLFVSGQISRKDGAAVTGKVGDTVDTKTANALARQTAIDMLATLRAALGSLDDVTFIKLSGFVNSAPGYTEQPAVINGASDLFVEVLGAERGTHARCAIGVAELPLGAAVEIEAIVEVGTPGGTNR
jgi:enamine deaminase RidA (YjgF/YER057c/UK114 family)